jgi:membrane protein implicated in regulation of membrane protease activity
MHVDFTVQGVFLVAAAAVLALYVARRRSRKSNQNASKIG